MANTTSLSFPNMFDVARNRVSVMEDNVSLVNRSRLLMLTETGELYNSPDFGSGLKRYLFQYNNKNTAAMMKERIVEQLRLHEPCVNPDQTSFADNVLMFSDDKSQIIDDNDPNTFKMTVGLSSIFGDTVEVNINGSD